MKMYTSEQLGLLALKSFVGFAAILFIAQWLKGYSINDSIEHALTWGAITTVIFVGTRWHYRRKGVYCALCDGKEEIK